MTKADTEKELLALRYPIDIDVTDDVLKKRYFSNSRSYTLSLNYFFRTDYVPTGYGSSSSDGMKKLEEDVKEASKEYNEAEEIEDAAMAKLRRYQGIQTGAVVQTPEDADLMRENEESLKKSVARKAKARRKLRSQLDKRIKARDTATELKNEAVEKKEGQVYFDGMIYTTRWSSLPA